MSWIDWLIVVVPVVFIIGIAFYAKRYARSAADFLAAGRVAGRYVISVGDLMSWLSVIILIAGCEQTYQTGFGISFWNNILTPSALFSLLPDSAHTAGARPAASRKDSSLNCATAANSSESSPRSSAHSPK